MRFQCLALCLLAALAATPAAAQLSQIYVDWAAGPAQYLFTKDDREQWQEVSTDAEAEQFIRLFWARRNPNPDSADNEFRREFERRVAYADQRFGETVDDQPVRGSMTDRGRALILLGPPRRVQDPGAGGSTTGGDFGSGGGAFEGRDRGLDGGGGPIGIRGGATERFGVASEEVWIYEGESRPEFIKKRRLQVTFRSKPGTDEVELWQGEEAMGYMGEAIDRAIVDPDLTLADLGGGAAGATSLATGDFGLYAADPFDDAAVLSALRRDLEDAGGAGSMPAYLDAAAFQASDGTWIVPVQVAMAEPPPAGVELVGELVDAGGESKIAFHVPEPRWEESRDQQFVQATVVAPAGEYRLRAGLAAAGGEMVWAAEQAVEIPAADGIWLSEVVLSRDIRPMQHAQEMLEPWAWMGIAVVPEGDRTFEQGGVLWYYLHACQPRLDEAGKPKLRVTLELSGAASFRGPAVAEPVKAGDNCWVLASAYDLTPDRFPPGEYTMRLSVRDSVAGETVVAEPVSFRVASKG